VIGRTLKIFVVLAAILLAGFCAYNAGFFVGQY